VRGYVRNKSIILIDALPEEIEEGDEVELTIMLTAKQKFSFPTFDLEVKDEYLHREKMYEPDSDIL
jgi:hypothetical protein